jgi:hypothetical protein
MIGARKDVDKAENRAQPSAMVAHSPRKDAIVRWPNGGVELATVASEESKRRLLQIIAEPSLR